jgi:cytochrome c556
MKQSSPYEVEGFFEFSRHSENLISVFRRDVDEVCGLMGYCAASCGNCLPTFRANV